MVYKRIWLVIIAGFCEPVFYLLGVGVGLGEFVGEVTTEGGVSLSYAAFVAPGLLAASAMNGAIIESTFPIFFKLHYNRTYDAVLATPMRVADIAVGEILWSQLRAAIYACGFLVLMYIVGLTDTLWAVGALLGALLVGFTFSAAGFAAVTFMRTWHDFDMIQLVILPLFLFSGTFLSSERVPPLPPTHHADLSPISRNGVVASLHLGKLRLDASRSCRGAGGRGTGGPGDHLPPTRPDPPQMSDPLGSQIREALFSAPARPEEPEPPATQPESGRRLPTCRTTWRIDLYRWCASPAPSTKP